MTKVNIEGFVEVECPHLNAQKMKAENLAKSPKLKVQLFLNFKEASEALRDSECTKIICPTLDGYSKCSYIHNNCLYGNISLDNPNEPRHI
jgi:hypothetical protein